MPSASYATTARAWLGYQAHLPPDLRVDGNAAPAEEWWPWEGIDVHLDRIAQPDAPVVVLVLHGGGGYGRMLAPIGRATASGGAEVVLPDLPGDGLTACRARDMTYERWVRCVVALVARETASGRTVALAGLSMGGMLAYHAAAAAPRGAVAAVAATTLMDPRMPEVRRRVGRLPTPRFALRFAAADRLVLPMPLLAPVERMSSVKAVNRLVLRDPCGGGRRVPLGFLRSWMRYEPALEPEQFDRCPVLLAHPLADRWTPVAWSRAFLARVAAPTAFVGLERCEHLPLEEPGLTRLRSELAAWVASTARAAAAASTGGRRTTTS